MLENFMKNPHLDGESFYNLGGKTGILLLHGFTATTAEVRLLADHLVKNGHTVAAPLLPGHGTHPNDLNKKTWMDWYEAAEAAFFRLQQDCDQVFVGGESMGTLLSLMLSSRYHKVSGLILASPAMKVKNLSAAYVLQYFKKHQPKNQKEDGLAWKGYNVYPLKAAVQLLKLQNVVKKELGNIDQPMLIFVGDKDTTITPDAGELIFEAVPSIDKRLVHLPESPHCLLLAHEMDRVTAEVDTFLQEQILIDQALQ